MFVLFVRQPLSHKSLVLRQFIVLFLIRGFRDDHFDRHLVLKLEGLHKHHRRIL